MPSSAAALLLALAPGSFRPAPPAEPAPQQPAWPGALSRVVLLAEGPRVVEVNDRGGGAAVCQRLLNTAAGALPLVERVAGFPLPSRGPVRIQVFESTDPIGGYAGNHNGREVNVWREISDRGLIHELAHYWFSRRFVRDSYRSERWITEGLAEYVAVQALRGAPALGDAAWGHRENLAHWTSDKSGQRPLLRTGIPVFPLAQGERPAAEARDWYARAYSFFHLLSHHLGEDTLRAVHAELELSHRPVTSESYLSALGAHTPDVEALIAGWLHPGPFHGALHPDLLRDTDGDGLTDAEERTRGTSRHDRDTDGDGEHDGVETLLFRSDPCDPGSRPERLDYAIDGLLDEWNGESPSARYRYDPVGDLENRGPRACDLGAAWFDADEVYFYVVFRLAEELEQGARYEVGIDRDGDDVFDVVITCDPDLTVRVGHLYGDWEASDWHPVALAPAAVRGRNIELAVPRGAIGAQGKVRLYAFSVFRPGGTADWVYGDQLRGWIPFELP